MLKKTTIVIVALVFAMTVSVFLYRHRTATQSYSNEEISGSALNAPPQTSETQTVAVSEYNQPSTTSPPQLPDNLIASTPYDPIAPIAFEPASTSPDEIRATLLNDPVLLELKPEKLEELVQGMVLLGESYNAIRSRYNVETIEGYRQMLVDDANANIEGRDGQFYAARLERFDSLTDSEKERTVYLYNNPAEMLAGVKEIPSPKVDGTETQELLVPYFKEDGTLGMRMTTTTVIKPSGQ